MLVVNPDIVISVSVSQYMYMYTSRHKACNSPGCCAYCVVNFFNIFVCDVLAPYQESNSNEVASIGAMTVSTASITAWIQDMSSG
jgi:hypothetical protein